MHRNTRRLLVADLADHDHVGVLPQDAAKRAGERQPDRWLDLHLVDPLQLVFDRVLDRHHIHARSAQHLQRRVQRGGLSAAGGAGHQHHAVRLTQDALEARQRLRAEPEVFHFRLEVRFVQDSYDDLLAQQRRQARYAKVDLPPLRLEPHSPFLRQALLGNVHPRQHLHSRDDGRVHPGRRLRQLTQHAVDAAADVRGGGLGLEVDVAGLLADRAEAPR